MESRTKIYFDTCLIVKFIEVERLDIIEKYLSKRYMDPIIVKEVDRELSTFRHVRKDISWDKLRRDKFINEHEMDMKLMSETRILVNQMCKDSSSKNKNGTASEEKANKTKNFAEAYIIVLAEKELSGSGEVSFIATDDQLALCMALRRKLRGVYALQMMELAGLSSQEIDEIFKNKPIGTGFVTHEGFSNFIKRFKRTSINPTEPPAES